MHGFTRAPENADERFYTVSTDASTGIVLLCRTHEPYDDDAQVVRETARLAGVLDQVGRRGKRLLVDVRRAPIDTDTRMALSFREQRREVRRGFVAVAVVVQTQVGRLQANRLAGELGPGEADPVYDDFDVALKLLLDR